MCVLCIHIILCIYIYCRYILIYNETGSKRHWCPASTIDHGVLISWIGTAHTPCKINSEHEHCPFGKELPDYQMISWLIILSACVDSDSRRLISLGPETISFYLVWGLMMSHVPKAIQFPSLNVDILSWEAVVLVLKYFRTCHLKKYILAVVLVVNNLVFHMCICIK